ncbi:MAG: polysaccharide lyase 6 family protein [Bacteroidota bacterium]
MLYKKFLILILSIIVLNACGDKATDGILVRNLDAFDKAVQSAKAGDRIVLANGVWKDAELVFSGEGTEGAPIILTVEEKGKVSLEGQSNLRIAGKYLHVEGLVFKNGYTPTNEVISFRRNKETLANYCRVTECVIDNYNNPERFESDYWVGIYGKHNRFDHNYLTGKRNQGVTLAVRLNTEESRENFNRVDHNYFGHRPILGSNGGETLRIGTSHYSLTNSNTLVEYNYFNKANGEHEIISNKSGQNTYSNNTFFECQGTLTMRHGNETMVKENYFFGNGKPNTGGIRIINEKQTVVGNYCEGLTGYRFRGALVIMNGVPNSPLNRYFQVKDSKASNNSFINCDYIQLCAGSDEERSATPENTVVNNNLVYNTEKNDVFTVYDDISGISFTDNLLSPNIPALNAGFEQKELRFVRDDNGLLMPEGVEGIGISEVTGRATEENTGVSWYPKKEDGIRFGYGKTIGIKAGENTLFEAIKNSAAGDVIELEEGGEYLMTKSISFNHPITVQAKEGLAEKPLLLFERTTLFNIENGGALSLKGIAVSGRESDDKPGNAVIRTSKYSMVNNYKLEIRDCAFKDLDVNHSFEVLKVFKNTFAESILIEDSHFENITGSVLAMNKESDDIGIYNVENVDVRNSLFKNVGGAAINLYRGGRDESTFGPILRIDHCVFDEVGKDKRNAIDASVAIHGVQDALIENSIFNESKPLRMHLVVGEPVIRIFNNNLYNSGKIISNDPAYQTSNLSSQKPEWSSDSYQLSTNSSLKSKGRDSKDLGLLLE